MNKKFAFFLAALICLTAMEAASVAQTPAKTPSNPAEALYLQYSQTYKTGGVSREALARAGFTTEILANGGATHTILCLTETATKRKTWGAGDDFQEALHEALLRMIREKESQK